MRWAARRDDSEAEIVQALRKAGCLVCLADDVDAFVFLAGRTVGLEFKTPGRQKRLQPIQKWLKQYWQDYHIVTTPEEALKAVGL